MQFIVDPNFTFYKNKIEFLNQLKDNFKLNINRINSQ